MMIGKKRMLSLMLVVVMIVCQFATLSANAAESPRIIFGEDYYSSSPTDDELITTEDELYQYRILEDETAQIYRYNGTSESNVTIPGKIDDYTVTSIFDEAFDGHGEIEDITIPDSIVHIGERAFYNTSCYNDAMKNNDGVFYIDKFLILAEATSSDEQVPLLIVKEGTTLIADYAISGYAWLYIPASVKNIGNSYSVSHVVYGGSEEDTINCLDEDFEIDDYNGSATTFTTKNKVAATCSKSGSIDFYCSICKITDNQALPRPDHTKGTKVLTVAPSCENRGEGYTIYRCKNCSVLFAADYVSGDDYYSHTKGSVIKVVAPTCTVSGYTLYRCTVCDQTFDDDYKNSERYNDGLGHEKGQLIKTIVPSCDNGGEGYSIYSCLYCDSEIYDDYNYNYDYTHNYVFKEKVAQTCTKTGYNLYECTVCKNTTESDFDYALGHVKGKFISEQKTSTCLNPAYKEYNCLICKQNYKDILFEDYGEEDTTYPTHQFVNDICKTCKVAQSNVVESDHPYAHSLDKTWTITRNCDYMNITFSSYTRLEWDCDYIYIYDKNDELVGKYTGSELSGQTVKVEGNTAKIRLTSDTSVSYYGFSTTKIEAVCNHTYNAGTITTNPTCTKAGVKTYTCTKCGVKKTETVKATGHKSNAGVVTKAATYDATGVKTYTCTVCKKVIKTETIAKKAKTSLKKATITVKDQTYSGKAKTPSITVKLNGKTLTKNTDYTVSYKNNKSIGKATVTVKGIKKYSGSVSKTFKINPKKVTDLKLKSSKKKELTVSWKKDSKVTGYQIVYATNSKLTKGKKTVTVTSYKTYKKTIKKLKSKKTYYVKVRSYKTVSGKKYYSAYAATQKLKIK